ncbi:YppG-like protein [Thalassobacillus cyri]|uniref:YppG-like protein n=1 Tax=Thalassobacillus cyri TaxID=571932 RepID=A0A1H4H8Y4_9BACI|nr:YppG family protein [Thalassobacillus cyri]SEB18293.1 YppG-like protein [Thalassobacillus cyri]
MFSYSDRNYQQQPFYPYPYQQQPMMGENPYGYPQSWNMPHAPGNPFEYYTKPMFPQQQNHMQSGYGSQPFFYNNGVNPKNMIGYFQDQNGQIDMDKMMKTVGQVAQTANQLSPLMKGIGGFIKGMR